MEYLHVHVDGRQFERAYMVYVVRVALESGATYFYVGQTGDRNYRTARPAFRRLAGHFDEQGSSTQNQIYRALAEREFGSAIGPRSKFSVDLRDSMARLLTSSKIDMFAFRIAAFEPTASDVDHKELVKRVERIEQATLSELTARYGREMILNRKFQVGQIDGDSLKLAEGILATVGSELGK